MKTWVLVLTILVTARAIMKAPKIIQINDTTTCGQSYNVTQNTEYKLNATGNSPAENCSFTFRAEPVNGSTCTPGLCFMFGPYGRIDSPLVTLSVEAGTNNRTYSNQTTILQDPVCMANETSIQVLLTQQPGYTFDPQNPGYKFQLSVYHHCGEKGQVKNVKFEEVVKYAKGYYHGEELTRHEKLALNSGVGVGFGMAGFFILVLVVSKCYTRNSSKGGTSSYSLKGVYIEDNFSFRFEKPKATLKPVETASGSV